MNTNREQETASGQLRKLLARSPQDRALRVDREVLDGVLFEMLEQQQLATRALDDYQAKLMREMERVKELLPQIHGEAGFETKRRLKATADKMRELVGEATVSELIDRLEAGEFEPEKKKRTAVQYVAGER